MGKVKNSSSLSHCLIVVGTGVGMGGSMHPEGNIDYVEWRRER